MIITEHLTGKKTQLYKKANDLVQAKKLDSAWVHDGRIIAKCLDKRTFIVTANNLDQF